MAATLAFVLAPEHQLPPDAITDWGALQAAQLQSITEAQALRLFHASPALAAALPQLGFAGEVPEPLRHDGSCRLICDAVIPRFDVSTLWLAVYAVEGCSVGDRARPVDRFPLREAENEACWFYPTEDGTYLSWENGRRLDYAPGGLADPGIVEGPDGYRRSDVHVLWSLMADDSELTCVGITYRGLRIIWPEQACRPAEQATWRAFTVESSADPSYTLLSSRAVRRPADEQTG